MATRNFHITYVVYVILLLILESDQTTGLKDFLSYFIT